MVFFCLTTFDWLFSRSEHRGQPADTLHSITEDISFAPDDDDAGATQAQTPRTPRDVTSTRTTPRYTDDYESDSFTSTTETGSTTPTHARSPRPHADPEDSSFASSRSHSRSSSAKNTPTASAAVVPAPPPRASEVSEVKEVTSRRETTMELLPSERKSEAVTSQAPRDVATDDDISEQLSVEEQTPQSGSTSGSLDGAVLKIDLRAPAISTQVQEDEKDGDEGVKTPTQELSQPEVMSGGEVDIRNIEPPSMPMSQEPDVTLELSGDVRSEQGSPRKTADESLDEDEVSRKLVSLIQNAEEEVKQFAQEVEAEAPATPILSPPPSHADSPKAEAEEEVVEKKEDEKEEQAAASVARELLDDAVESLLSVRSAKMAAERLELRSEQLRVKRVRNRCLIVSVQIVYMMVTI